MLRYTAKNPRYRCATVDVSKHYNCETHRILQSTIEKAVFASIQVRAEIVVDSAEMALEALERERVAAKGLEVKIRDKHREITQLESSITKLFTSLASDVITKETFMHKKGLINNTIAQKKNALQQMESQMERWTTERAVAEKSIADWTPMLEIDMLDEDIVDLLISKILVHGENDIEIVWQGATDGDLP